jgi:hypothetical protein
MSETVPNLSGSPVDWPRTRADAKTKRQRRREELYACAGLHGPREVSVDEVPDARIEKPTDALIRITTTSICGSDLHMYEGRTDVDGLRRIRMPSPSSGSRRSRRRSTASSQKAAAGWPGRWALAMAWSALGNLIGGVGLVTSIRLLRVPHRVAVERAESRPN